MPKTGICMACPYEQFTALKPIYERIDLDLRCQPGSLTLYARNLVPDKIDFYHNTHADRCVLLVYLKH
jgi:hypothetical protein